MDIILAFDMQFEQFLYAIREPSTVQFFIWITELGNVYVFFGITLVSAIILAYKNRWALLAGLCTSAGGAFIIGNILKEIIARPRPGAPLYAYVEASSSFPSGHATRAVALYAFLLWLFYDTIPGRWRFISASAVTVLILGIGFSRLYLGVHYPSDVLAGYALGGLFVLLGIKVVKYLERRTSITPSI